MKRVRLLLLPGALALLALVIALWVRSYWRLDLLSRVKEDGTTRAAASYQGAWHFISAATNARCGPVEWDAYRVAPGATYATLHRVGSVEWEFGGFAQVATTPTMLMTVPGPVPGPTTRMIRVAAPPGGSVLPYGPSAVSPLVPWLGMGPYDAVIVPYWAVALVIGAVPLERLRRVIRAMMRRRRGCCIACGYDLRGSGERCPECGRPASVARDAADGAT